MLMRSTQLIVNIKSILSNITKIKSIVNNKQIIAVVKADGYGLGSIPITKALMDHGTSIFTIALLQEAVALRENNINTKLLMLSPFYEEEIPEIIRHSITPSLIDLPRAKALNDYGYKSNLQIPVHIKIDTGMGRLGIPIHEAFQFIQQVYDLNNLKIEGIYSHFPSADIPDREFTNHQIKLFSQLIRQYKEFSSQSPICHLANSSGIVNFPDSHFDAVRPGLMLYGCYPSQYTQSQIKLDKVVTLKTKIASLKSLPKDHGVSYGRTFITKSNSKIAVLPVGYADGYSTLLSSKGEVMIHNTKVPIVGRVCMDYTMIDVSNIDNVQVGDDVILIGQGITEEEIAKKTGLIPYEILTNISKRVPRVYVH